VKRFLFWGVQGTPLIICEDMGYSGKIASILFCFCTMSLASCSSDSSLFTLLSPDKTNVDFENTLTEGLNSNILMYEYFYNGGGVAIGDLNEDDLVDIYFTSNMGNNKLFMNEGNMRFRDVTSIAGIAGRPGPWKSGVAIADVNGDNRLDLYVCYSGALPDSKRSNQLFINQGSNEEGIPLFSDKANEYGLASTAFSNQIYFFDYDKDGDLDALLLNHSPESLPVLNEVNSAEMLAKDDPYRGVRLYNHDDRHFYDVTSKSGIISSPLTYGLGIAISDLNDDGWPDFYICNDYAVPDYLYMNNGDGTFTDKLKECLGHNSQFSMGNDIADVNNDGLPDIITLDMLPQDNRRQKLLMAPDNYAKFDLNVRSGFHYQYMRNMLQLNNGNGTYSEIGQLSGISNTDWSWAPLFADFNNDGWKDLLVTNGYLKDYTNLDFINYMNSYVRSKGRLMREDVLEIIEHIPSSNISNYIFSNEDGLTFSDMSKSWGLDYPSNSNGVAYADLDNDGDLDLVINNINQPAFIFLNNLDTGHGFLQIKLQGEGLNTQGIGAKITIFHNGTMQYLEQYQARGYLSSVSPVMHFGLDRTTIIDSLVVNWVSGKRQVLNNLQPNQRLTLSEQNASKTPASSVTDIPLFSEVPSPFDYQHPVLDFNDFIRQPLLISEFSYSGPCMVKGDLDNDGLEDIFIGGAWGQPGLLFFQQEDLSFRKERIPAFEQDRFCTDVDAVIFDANNDMLPDIYVASGGYHAYNLNDTLLNDRLYINNGGGSFIKSKNALPELPGSKGCIAINDINKDGYVDLFIGGRVIPGRYPEIPLSYFLVNNGNGHFSDQIVQIAPQLQRYGMITDAVWEDLNRDGFDDLIVVGEWLPVTVFLNEDGKLINKTLDFFEKEYKGWWNTIQTIDYNTDENADILVGNAGLNTQVRVAEEEPGEMYYRDFDSNGSVDPIFCFHIQGKSYPYLTRNELVRQFPGFRGSFIDYESYADVTLFDLFSEVEIASANRLEINHLETSLFERSEGGKYKLVSLPLQAQYGPVYTITVLDYNNDGRQDVLMCGNNDHAKLRLGKSDANYGVLLMNSEGGFKYVNQLKSGFQLKGDVRSVIKLDDVLIFGINQRALVSYRLNENSENLFQ
jgi:hypothetical protein